MAYGMILTSIGAAKLLAAATDETALVFEKFVWGDASGSPYEPTGDETALVNQLHETNVVSVEILEDTPNVYKVVGQLASAPSEFILREVGILDSDGDLIAIGNHAALTVPAAVGSDFTLNYAPSYLLVISPDLAVAVTLQPPGDFATEEWVTANFQPKGTYVKTVTGSAGITVIGSATDRDVRADEAWFNERYKGINDDAPGVESVSEGWAIDITGTASDPIVAVDKATLDANYRGINNPFDLPAHSHPNATQTANGFMSSPDKIKLDGIGSGFGDAILTRVASTVVSSPTIAIDVLNISGGGVYLIRGSGLRLSTQGGQTALLGLQTGKNSTLYSSASDYIGDIGGGNTGPWPNPYYALANSVTKYNGGGGAVPVGETWYRGILLCVVKLLNSPTRKTTFVPTASWDSFFDLLNIEPDYPANGSPAESLIRAAATEENRIRILPVGVDAAAQFTAGRVDVYKVN